jgi:hypothetical protein
MPRTSSLEVELARIVQDLAQQFVTRIVEALRSASFAEVAALSPGVASSPAPVTRAKRRSARAAAAKEAHETGRRPRQTATKRAELGDRLIAALSKAPSPLGVRALSSELRIAPDLLTAPLRELRAAGRIAKHGDKRNTTYSVTS